MAGLPKGFSFVLVTVVMSVMLAFGLLALSGAVADLRLAQKAARSQQDYYTLDRAAEQLTARCGDAAARAGQAADAFVAAGAYAQPLPADLPTPARELAQAAAAGSSGSSLPLRHALFFYFLGQNLKSLPTGSCSWTMDEEAIRQAAAGKAPASTPVLQLTAAVNDAAVPGRTMALTLAWSYGGPDGGYPAFPKAKRTLKTATQTIDPDPILPVWDGKG